jgi:ribonuclease BN (tRNA processing enzyme)
LSLQVLGSGGPIADDARSSSAYVLWVNGRSRVLVDAGGGAFLRFGEAGAEFTDLDFIGISHFHTDHSSDISALLKSGYFSQRERPLHIAGPGSGGQFPGLVDWLKRMLGDSSGAYAYLNGYLDGSDGMVWLSTAEINGDGAVRIRLTDHADPTLAVLALPVPHGIVPTLAFRIASQNRVVVFGSDQTGADPAFTEFARDADLLVMHLAIPEDADPIAQRLHATPRTLGAIAQSAEPDRLLLSHLMSRSLRAIDASVSIVGRYYKGEILVAEDLMCIELSPD